MPADAPRRRPHAVESVSGHHGAPALRCQAFHRLPRARNIVNGKHPNGASCGPSRAAILIYPCSTATILAPSSERAAERSVDGGTPSPSDRACRTHRSAGGTAPLSRRSADSPAHSRIVQARQHTIASDTQPRARPLDSTVSDAQPPATSLDPTASDAQPPVTSFDRTRGRGLTLTAPPDAHRPRRLMAP